MLKLLQTRAVNYEHLYAKNLINDLSEAANCDVKSVCRLSCNRCPYPLANIEPQKVNIQGLHSYSINLEKNDDQLLIVITARNIDSWLVKNHLQFTTRTTIAKEHKMLADTRLSVAPLCNQQAYKIS